VHIVVVRLDAEDAEEAAEVPDDDDDDDEDELDPEEAAVPGRLVD